MVGLGKQIAGVDEDNRDSRDHSIDEMQHDRCLGAEARGEHMSAGQKLRRPLDPLLGRKRHERFVDLTKSTLVCRIVAVSQPFSQRQF